MGQPSSGAWRGRRRLDGLHERQQQSGRERPSAFEGSCAGGRIRSGLRRIACGRGDPDVRDCRPLTHRHLSVLTSLRTSVSTMSEAVFGAALLNENIETILGAPAASQIEVTACRGAGTAHAPLTGVSRSMALGVQHSLEAPSSRGAHGGACAARRGLCMSLALAVSAAACLISQPALEEHRGRARAAQPAGDARTAHGGAACGAMRSAAAPSCAAPRPHKAAAPHDIYAAPATPTCDITRAASLCSRLSTHDGRQQQQ
jgi:hypothetical protein